MRHWKKHKSKMTIKVVNEAEKAVQERSTSEPYVHWFYRNGAADRGGPAQDNAFLDTSGAILRNAFRWYRDFFLENEPHPEEGAEADAAGDDNPPAGKHDKAIGDKYGGGILVPLPKGSVNPNFNAGQEWADEQIAERLPEVDKDTVVVGIIDTGISLCHENFRSLDGSTRFIASWQQGAKHTEEGGDHLPFGREIFAGEINGALRTHCLGSLAGNLDEDAFNRELGLVDPGDPTGQRDLDLPGAHGTHVLDLATGYVPKPDVETEEAMRQQRIIAVNLPAQKTHGTAGNFLAYLAYYALRRIIFLSDALWRKTYADSEEEPAVKGFPIVINFSYGMQAGPKDGSMLFEQFMQQALRERGEGMNSQIRIVMPAGNEAQLRGAASIVLGKEGAKHGPTGYDAAPTVTLPWRLSPADHTANYMEIWTDNEGSPEDILRQLKLCVTPPGGEILEVDDLELNHHYDLGVEDPPPARIYCEEKLGQIDNRSFRRLRLLLCTAPTASFEPDDVVAPAGLWQVELRYEAERPVDFKFHIQSDQSAVRTSENGMRSYFDHKKYQTHVLCPPPVGTRVKRKFPFGGPRDSYHWDPIAGYSAAEPWLDYGPVQRMGTQNALASAREDSLMCIGGYVGITGSPALYSGATDGNPDDDDESRSVVSVSFISETSPNHFGLLAAGSRNGSTVAYRGTSMATALATRTIADAFCLERDNDLTKIGIEDWLRRKTGKEKNDPRRVLNRCDHWGTCMPWNGAPILKLGVERIGLPESFQRNRVFRLGGVTPCAQSAAKCCDDGLH